MDLNIDMHCELWAWHGVGKHFVGNVFIGDTAQNKKNLARLTDSQASRSKNWHAIIKR